MISIILLLLSTITNAQNIPHNLWNNYNASGYTSADQFSQVRPSVTEVQNLTSYQVQQTNNTQQNIAPQYNNPPATQSVNQYQSQYQIPQQQITTTPSQQQYIDAIQQQKLQYEQQMIMQSSVVPMQSIQQQNMMDQSLQKQALPLEFIPDATSQALPNDAYQSNKSSPMIFNRYYAMNLGTHLQQKYTFLDTDTKKSSSISKSGFGKHGLIGLYSGRRLQKIPFIRFEYGMQWELLSLEEPNQSTTYNIHQHSAGFSFRTFGDLPISNALTLNAGLEGNFGLMNNIVSNDQHITFGYSYAMLLGATMRISDSRAVYVLLRQGVMPNKNYKVLNTVRQTKFNSTGIVVGMQLFSF